MPVRPFTALACPLDGLPLIAHASGWHCEAGHSFDTAREGYTHLLPVQHKRSLDPGDSKPMVMARHRFLDSGCYRPIAEAVVAATFAEHAPDTVLSCLDAGCGEGYYLRQLIAGADNRALQVIGLDISKWAVQAAAKQRDSRDATWIVGTNARLPILTGTVDRILCLFGFPVADEFARVLRTGGALIRIDAGADHLRELREIIYPVVKPAAEAPLAMRGFHSEQSDRLRYRITLESAEQIADLLAMTPHLHRATAAGRERAAALKTLTVTVDVQITRLRPLENASVPAAG